jgi:hypothetical protein
MIIEETIFRKKPILVIKDDEGKRILFSAGLNKVRVVLENFDSLKSFFDKYNIISKDIIK